MRSLNASIVFVCLMVCLAPVGTQAQDERILSYDSRIDVFTEGDVVVTETIRVLAAGRKIQHGIYRDFPTRYRNNRGNQVVVRFDVLEVRRDDRPEAYHTQSLSNAQGADPGR